MLVEKFRNQIDIQGAGSVQLCRKRSIDRELDLAGRKIGDLWNHSDSKARLAIPTIRFNKSSIYAPTSLENNIICPTSRDLRAAFVHRQHHIQTGITIFFRHATHLKPDRSHRGLYEESAVTIFNLHASHQWALTVQVNARLIFWCDVNA